MYLVYESALLLLFTLCIACKKATTIIEKSVFGTFLSLKQFCKNCKHKHIWQSQPHIGSIPAGNILMSAAVLYTGSLPAKALRIFKFLHCPTISTSTFFRHQSSILRPAINAVWLRHQDLLLRKLKENQVKLHVGGDGRADSPGHCAEFGTYSLIELNSNQIVDFQLVQVTDNCWAIIIIKDRKNI